MSGVKVAVDVVLEVLGLIREEPIVFEINVVPLKVKLALPAALLLPSLYTT